MAESMPVSCEEALKRLMEFVDGELAGADHDVIERHLRTCRSCFSRMEFERQLKERLSTISSEPVPAAWRDRIRQLISRL